MSFFGGLHHSNPRCGAVGHTLLYRVAAIVKRRESYGSLTKQVRSMNLDLDLDLSSGLINTRVGLGMPSRQETFLSSGSRATPWRTAVYPPSSWIYTLLVVVSGSTGQNVLPLEWRHCFDSTLGECRLASTPSLFDLRAQSVFNQSVQRFPPPIPRCANICGSDSGCDAFSVEGLSAAEVSCTLYNANHHGVMGTNHSAECFVRRSGCALNFSTALPVGFDPVITASELSYASAIGAAVPAYATFASHREINLTAFAYTGFEYAPNSGKLYGAPFNAGTAPALVWLAIFPASLPFCCHRLGALLT